MIAKIKKINNIFSYNHFDWDKINHHQYVDKDGNIQTFDGSLNKCNVFYGENRNGKSNLVKIFKHLNGEMIDLEHHWDCMGENQEIEVQLQDGSVLTYLSSGWDSKSLTGKFLVFDKVFIEKYVHAVGVECTDTAERKKNRGRNIVYLGNFAGYKHDIDQINDLKEVIVQKNAELRRNQHSRLNVFIDTKYISEDELTKPEVKQYIATLDQLKKASLKIALKNKQDELIRINKVIQEKTKITALSKLSSIAQNFTLEYSISDEDKGILEPSSLLSFKIENEISKITEKIQHKEDFIRKGLSYIDENVELCPFCEQKIKNGEYITIIKNYKEIFSEEFENKIKMIESRLDAYKNILENLRDFEVPSNNAESIEILKTYLSFEPLPLCKLIDAEKILLKSELKRIDDKKTNLFGYISQSEITDIKTVMNRLNQSINAYKTSITSINAKVDELKDKVKKGTLETEKTSIEEQILQVEKDIYFMGKKVQFDRYFATASKIDQNDSILQLLENIYSKMKEKAITEFQEFVNGYFDTIKDLVNKICPTMDIFGLKGEPIIDRRATELTQCAFDVSYRDRSCVASLSEGEKQTISLAFFIAQLKKEPDKNKIVIFDEPITNFDAGKRKTLTELIHDETIDFTQLFIFTCDPLFREFCLKELNNRNFYYIFSTKGFSSIHYVPKKRETIYQSFEDDFHNIDNFVGNDENIILFGQKLRFCLETKIKEDYLGYSQDSFANMLDQIASKGDAGLKKLIDKKTLILQIYKYCNTTVAHYPKDGATSWTELKAKIKQYLELGL